VNRIATEFVDNPATFDIDRNTLGHSGFGYGVHQRMGANLAPTEIGSAAE
jgi:cytochrome P450